MSYFNQDSTELNVHKFILLTANRSFPTGASAYGMPKNDSYSSIWKPGRATPSMHPSAVHTIGNTLVKLSSVNGDDINASLLPTVAIGAFDDEITVGLDAFINSISRNVIKYENPFKYRRILRGFIQFF